MECLHDFTVKFQNMCCNSYISQPTFLWIYNKKTIELIFLKYILDLTAHTGLRAFHSFG